MLLNLNAISQQTLDEVTSKEVANRISYIKSKTDSFLFAKHNASFKFHFKFEFAYCSYSIGEMHSIYQFINSDKPEAQEINDLTHFYSFDDNTINLKGGISVYFYEYNEAEVRFRTSGDSLAYEALNKIYNKGVLQKIKAQIAKAKLKQPYTILQINEGNKSFDIILKDKIIPHNYFIK